MRKKDRWMLCKEEQELSTDWCASAAGVHPGLHGQGCEHKGKETKFCVILWVAHLQIESWNHRIIKVGKVSKIIWPKRPPITSFAQ